MNLILWDNSKKNLWPFTLTRPVHQLRVGISTIQEKWEEEFGEVNGHAVPEHLQNRFRMHTDADNCLINGAVLPNPLLVQEIKSLEVGQLLCHDSEIIAVRFRNGEMPSLDDPELINLSDLVTFTASDPVTISHPWDLFQQCGVAIQADMEDMLADEALCGTDSGIGNTFINPGQIVIHPEAKVNGAFLNASSGPIYIGKGAEVMEGAMIRGPFALCEGATVKMGAKIYGATTIGPYCKIGGEVSNSVFIGYSNKGHDGFVGNSVIGEWCNLGADTNTSNLKNNYGDVRVWSYEAEKPISSGTQFCGLMMGDHSKSGINTMFNTGTVVGVNANVWGGDFPAKFIPSYAWGGKIGFDVFDIEKSFEVAERMMERRSKALTNEDKANLHEIFEMTAKYRNETNGFSSEPDK